MGAGGIGGVLGARLHEAGHDVVLVARGAHHDAIAAHGLRVESPDGTVDATDARGRRLRRASRRAPTTSSLLTTKSQHSVAALGALAEAGFGDRPVVCVQNGVQNERAALRRFAPRLRLLRHVPDHVPRSRRGPGALGTRDGHPRRRPLSLGVDDTAQGVAGAFAGATFSAEPVVDIMRWKYCKLLMNLGNAVEAVCGPSARGGEIGRRARDEGAACLTAAGIDVRLRSRRRRPAAATWCASCPSPARPAGAGRRGRAWPGGRGSIETDYLNGEIVLLGRLHGVPTPVNALLQRLAGAMARTGRPPGELGAEEFLGPDGVTWDRGIVRRNPGVIAASVCWQLAVACSWLTRRAN